MRTKTLGRTGIEVSIVGLGGATLGYGPEDTMDLELGVATVIAAIEAGATLVDTAPKYGKGMS